MQTLKLPELLISSFRQLRGVKKTEPSLIANAVLERSSRLRKLPARPSVIFVFSNFSPKLGVSGISLKSGLTPRAYLVYFKNSPLIKLVILPESMATRILTNLAVFNGQKPLNHANKNDDFLKMENSTHLPVKRNSFLNRPPLFPSRPAKNTHSPC